MSTLLKESDTDRAKGSSRSSSKKAEEPEQTRRPRKSVGEHARDFNPDQRWFAPFIAAQVLYIGSALTVLMGLPTMIAAIIGGSVGIAVMISAAMAAWNVFDEREYGPQHRRQVVKLLVAAGGAGAGWMSFAATQSPISPVALGLLALWVMVAGSFWASLHTKSTQRKQDQADYVAAKREEVAERQHERAVSNKVEKWKPILAKAGLDGVTVYDWEETKAGDCFYLMDSPTEPVQLDGIQNALGKIASIAAHELAAEGVKLAGHQLRVEEGDAAHLFKLHISTKNRFRESLAYPTDRPMQSIADPINPGSYEDGEDVQLTLLGGHMFMVAATGGGKDVFGNNITAEAGNTSNCKLWAGGTAKLMPYVWPWLSAWLRGECDKPALDRVAGEDPAEVGQMLADLYKIGTLRNKKLGPLSKHQPTPKDPAYLGVLTEASDYLRDHPNERITTFDGRTWSPSALVDVICRAFRSAGVMLFMMSQYGLMDATGNYGSYIMRNVPIRVAGKTMSFQDGPQTLPGLKGMGTDTTKLRNFTLLIQPNSEEPRAMPMKSYVLDGEDQIKPFAIRNATQSPARDPQWICDALGTSHTDRWNPARHPDLVALCEELGLSWPSQPSETSGTVSGDQPATPATEQQHDEGVADEHARMSQEEINAMLEHAETKFSEANEHLKKYGILGKTMHHVFEVVMAENAPEWVPAGQLAFVIDRVDEGGDWDTAGRELADELAQGPWYLKPETRDGQIGWPRDLIRHTVQAWVEGGQAPMEVPSQNRAASESAAAPSHPLAHAAQMVADREAGSWVTAAELAKLMGRVTDETDESEKKSMQTRLGRELGQFVESKRTAKGATYEVDAIRAAAAQFAS